MNAPTPPLPTLCHERLAAAAPFLWMALLALLTAGGVAAAAIHAPTKPLMWVVAYLVLVGGVAQGVLGIGQALLPAQPPSTTWRHAEWWLFNLGNAGVIAGTLRAAPSWVALGTAAFAAALVAFLLGVRGAGAGWLLHAFRAVLVVTSLGACVGLALTVSGVAV